MEVILFLALFILAFLSGYASYMFGYNNGVTDTRKRIATFALNQFSFACKFWIAEVLERT